MLRNQVITVWNSFKDKVNKLKLSPKEKEIWNYLRDECKTNNLGETNIEEKHWSELKEIQWRDKCCETMDKVASFQDDINNPILSDYLDLSLQHSLLVSSWKRVFNSFWESKN